MERGLPRYHARLVLLGALLAPVAVGMQDICCHVSTPPRGRLAAPAAAPAPLARVTVIVDRPGASIPPDFAGLSMEYTAVGAYLGVDPGDPNTVFRRLMTNLGHGTLRIGGNSQDTSCWAPSAGTPARAGCAFTFGSALPRTILATMTATGWRALVGLNLALDDPASALRYVTQGLLSVATRANLLGLEIGNEPDLYAGNRLRPSPYTLARYLREFSAYVTVLKGDRRTAWMPLAGPSSITQDWDEQLGSFLSGVGARRLGFTTLHYYPFSVCTPAAAAQVTPANLLSENTMATLSERFTRYVALARAHDQTVHLDEINSASCHGKAGVSDSFSSALWGLDVLFTLARGGLVGVNFHIYDLKRSPGHYNAIVSTASRSSTGAWTYTTVVHPLYYAMLLFSSAEGSRFLPSTLTGLRANIKAYAVADGTTLRVFLLNKSLGASGSAASGAVTLALSRRLGVATLTVLRAPSQSAITGTTLGGSAIDARTGLLPSPRTQTLAPDPATGTYSVALPAAAAVVVALHLRR